MAQISQNFWICCQCHHCTNSCKINVADAKIDFSFIHQIDSTKIKAVWLLSHISSNLNIANLHKQTMGYCCNVMVSSLSHLVIYWHTGRSILFLDTLNGSYDKNTIHTNKVVVVICSVYIDISSKTMNIQISKILHSKKLNWKL